jgi:hypothetical protein
MTKVNGHAAAPSIVSTATPPPIGVAVGSNAPQFTPSEIRALIAKLEVPFHPSVIEWRVINTTKRVQDRGQVIPYADQRAYTDRLNDLLTPAGWTRKYAVTTSANFQRVKDATTVAKVFVTCELTIFGLGTHSATGEEWADDANAGTSAEAQAFKRACSCFGLGRYLYHFSGVWVDLDDRKRPKKVPHLFGWATPEGWAQGLRPTQQEVHHSEQRTQPPCPSRAPGERRGTGNAVNLIRQIEALEQAIGKPLYRGLLKTIAKAWKPTQIRNLTLLQKVLEHMQGAQRGLVRLDAAVNILGPAALEQVLRDLNLSSFAQVDNFDTLKQIVLALEQQAGKVRS